MEIPGVVREQFVTEQKRECSRTLRRAMTEPEAIFWRRIRGRQIAGLKFRRQQVIDGFIVDYYCCEARVAVEIDGSIHIQNADYDRHRDEILSQWEIVTIRIANQRIVEELDRVISEIVEICRQRRK